MSFRYFAFCNTFPFFVACFASACVLIVIALFNTICTMLVVVVELHLQLKSNYQLNGYKFCKTLVRCTHFYTKQWTTFGL